MIHQVLKRFKAGEKMLEVGELIETSNWKNERVLLEHRFIGKPASQPNRAPNRQAETPAPKEPPKLVNPVKGKPVALARVQSSSGKVVGKVPAK